ncbi:MAG: mechanosensitive ion channel family protein [Nanobdellota archaeon]
MNITNTTSFVEGINIIAEKNTLNNYLIALAVFIGIIAFLKIFELYIIHKIKKIAKKTKTKIDDMGIEFIEQLGWPFNSVVSLFIISKTLTLPEFVEKALFYLLWFILTFYLVRGMFKGIDVFVKEQIKIKKKTEYGGSVQLIRVIGTIGKIFLVIIAVLLLLSNFGINISSLLAGVGIGGIAIAFALQNILSDLFSSFSIYFDKPFVEGDFIVIGNDLGTVKRIGLKSTRIQTLQGQELIVSNNELTSTRINNYKKLEERRVVFTIGVVYSTPVKKLEKIPGIIKEIIGNTQKARFDRANFKSYGDFSLVYEIVYYAETADYNEYMDINEKINLGIAKEFEKEKIEFAFPTQTIQLQKNEMQK